MSVLWYSFCGLIALSVFAHIGVGIAGLRRCIQLRRIEREAELQANQDTEAWHK